MKNMITIPKRESAILCQELGSFILIEKFNVTEDVRVDFFQSFFNPGVATIVRVEVHRTRKGIVTEKFTVAQREHAISVRREKVLNSDQPRPGELAERLIGLKFISHDQAAVRQRFNVGFINLWFCDKSEDAEKR